MESTPLLTEPASEEPIRQHAIGKYTIVPVALLYFLYFSGSIPMSSQFVHHQLSVSNTTKDAQSEASLYLMYMNIAFTVPSFFSTIILGGYSDHAGRKVAIVSPLTGAGIRMLIFISVCAFNLHLGFLIVASALDGIAGGACSMLMSLFSFVSDITDSEHRSAGIVLLEFCIGISVVISILGTGYGIAYLGFLWMFVVLLGLVLLSLICTVFLLPETVVRSPTNDAIRLFQASHFTRLFALFFRNVNDSVAQRHQKLSLLFCLIVVFFVSSIELGRNDVMTLFMLAPPLCFNSIWIGYYSAWAYLILNVCMICFTYLLVKRFGDLKLIVVGLLSGMGYMLTFGLATTTLVLFLAPVVGCLSTLSMALVRAFSSKIVEPTSLGSLFAAVAWFQTMGILVGGVIQNAVMAATASFMEGLVFYLDAGLFFVTTILFICFIIWRKRRRPTGEGIEAQIGEDYAGLVN